MAHTVTFLPDAPIMVARFIDPFEPEFEIPTIGQALTQAMVPTEGRHAYIADVSALQEMGFGQMVVALSEAFRNPANAIFTDPRVIFLVVGSPQMYRLAIEAAKQPQYGGSGLALFPTLDEAIAEARARLQQTA